jgi:predicted DsbA family dithiol-disulfide isomerase
MSERTGDPDPSQAARTTPELRFVVYSDYLCPWCVNADLRLRRLEEQYAGRVALEFKSFLLRPEARPEPESDEHAARALEKFRDYTRAWERIGAEPDAGEFRVWQGDEGPPTHSIPAHAVAKASARLGREAFRRMHERLLRAYFVENRDISREPVLRSLWDELGLEPAAFEARTDPAVLEEILDDHREALRFGATGVPAVRLEDNEAVIVGAQPMELYQRWIDRTLARRANA